MAESVNPPPEGSRAAADQSVWKRSRLTGDWGGRPVPDGSGRVTINLEYTLYYQGFMSGTGSQTFEFANRLDGFVKLDTGALGLWKGGGLTIHLEYRSGALPGALGDAFFPTDSGMEFPSDSPDTLVATSLCLSQRFGDRVSF